MIEIKTIKNKQQYEAAKNEVLELKEIYELKTGEIKQYEERMASKYKNDDAMKRLISKTATGYCRTCDDNRFDCKECKLSYLGRFTRVVKDNFDAMAEYCGICESQYSDKCTLCPVTHVRREVEFVLDAMVLNP